MSRPGFCTDPYCVVCGFGVPCAQANTPRGRQPDGLFEFLAHGDEKHRAWLKAAITAFFAGQPRPPEDAV